MAQEFEQQPIQVVDRGIKSWCALQSESCRVPWGDGVVGSSDATTCVILFILSSVGVSVLHADEDSSQNLDYMQRCIPEKTERADLYLVGGYEDEEGTSQRVVNNVLSFLHESPVLLELKQAFVGTLNTVGVDDDRGRRVAIPRHQAACLDLKSRVLRPAQFAYRGPAFSIRQCRLLSGNKSLGELRHGATGSFQVQQWDFRLSSQVTCHFHRLLQLDDSALLERTSTSPQAEGPRFVEDTRETLQMLIRCPSSALLFPQGDLFFRWNGQEWVLAKEGGLGGDMALPSHTERDVKTVANAASN